MIVHARSDAMHGADKCARSASHHAQTDAAFSFTCGCARDHCFTLIVSNLRETEHAAIRGLIRSGLCEVIERRARCLNYMACDEWSALGCALLGALDAAFPFEHRPAVEIMLREFGENPVEIYLAVPGRTKTSGAVDPGLIAAVHTLTSSGIELRVLDMKHLDPLVIKIQVLQIIELLQNEVAGVEQDIASRVTAHALEKHFKRRAVVQIFAGMNLETEINPRSVKCIENRLPASRQFVERGFDQPSGALRPWINIRPRERAGKCGMRAKAEIRRSFRRILQLLHSPSLPRARTPLHRVRRKAIERDVVSRMHRDKLPLQVRRQLSQMQPLARQRAGHLVAISLALRGALQIKKMPIP